MADGSSPDEEMVICPLDKNHKILKKRLQFHLVRCKKNHDMSKKATCQFNSTHIVDKDELQAHYVTCVDRYEQQKITTKESPEEHEKRWGGTISLQDVVKAQEQSPTQGENWDDDPAVGTYDPYQATENREVTRAIMVEPKSVKKTFRQNERQRMAECDRNRGYSGVNTPRQVQVKTPSKPVPAAKTITTVSAKENRKIVDQVQTKTQGLPTVADQLVADLKLLDISNKPKILNTDDFPALQPSKSFSGGLKSRKPSGKKQESKTLNRK